MNPLSASKPRSALAALVLVLVAALFLAGCGGGDETSGDDAGGQSESNTTDSNTTDSNTTDSAEEDASDATEEGSSSGVPRETGFYGASQTDAEPQQGGTLSIGMLTEVGSLDPATVFSGSASGGIEVAAIYDVLVRYDPMTGDYEPWMAKSLEHSDDYATWTLGLREGVTFTDGTPLDAAAVVANVERCAEGRYADLVASIASMETPDDRTVVFHLKGPWARFPYVLTAGPGKVASPTAVEKWGEDLGSHPVGAGPFVFDHYSPDEELVLTANENYWGEGPYLDQLRFVTLDGETRLDTLEAGEFQAAFLRLTPNIAEARAAGFGGFANVTNGGLTLLVNNSEGRPGHDPRVRKAMAYAINLEQFNERVLDGTGLMQKEVMASTSRWATEAEATPYDPEKATSLVAEAKADGFDGKVTILQTSDRVGVKQSLVLQAMFNAVGFDVTIQSVPSVAAKIGNVIDGTYDITIYGISILDAVPWEGLTALQSDGSTNRSRYNNPEMDALLDKLHDAPSEEAKQQVLNDIQKLWTETVPMVSLAAIPEFMAWDDSLHGVVPTVHTVLLLSEAWLSD